MADRFRILAADKLAEEGLAYLRDQPDVDLDNRPGTSEQELADMIGGYDGLIVRSGARVTAKVFERAGKLQAVARAGVGVDNIDLAAATAAGVLVMNSAEASTITTAEHAFALLMALARRIGPAYQSMTQGRWERQQFQGRQLAGKTLGVVGFGRIGQTVAARALAFEMNVVAYDPFYNAATALDGQVKIYPDFDQMLPAVDALTFHVPLNEQTTAMMGDQAFAKVRPGVLIVNTSRGGVVDEAAVIRALDAGQCAGAAFDVFETEPPDADNPLRRHPLVLTTPHLGASTVEAQQAVSIDASTSLLDFLRGRGVRGAVNVQGLRLDLDAVQRRYVDMAVRMAHLISTMIGSGISRVTLDLAGPGLPAAVTTIERMALIGLLQPHLDTRLNLVNVRHAAEQRGINLRAVINDAEKMAGPQIAIEVVCPDRTHRIVGRMYNDMRPRVVEINGYHMDMFPAGHLVLIHNEDRPGIIGLVGSQFGAANINIADMAISRRGDSALMLLRVDTQSPESLCDQLMQCDGILKVARVCLPEESEPS